MMAPRATGLATALGLLLAGCTDQGSVPIYVGDTLVTTFGESGTAAASADGTAAQASRPAVGLGSIFASGGTPIYIGGRRVNCPEGQPDC